MRWPVLVTDKLGPRRSWGRGSGRTGGILHGRRGSRATGRSMRSSFVGGEGGIWGGLS